MNIEEIKSKKPPSICFVTPNAYAILANDTSVKHVGGAELQQVVLAKAFVRKGYTVSMICMDHGQDEGIIIDGVTVYKAHKPQGGIPLLRFIHPRLTSVWSAMKRANADIYYQRGAGMLTGVFAKFCQLNHKKSIYSGAHNEDFLVGSPKIKYKRDKWLFKYGVLHVDKILAQNSEQKKLLLDNYNRKSVVINNVYTPPIKRTNNRKGYILWVSTLRDFKQPQLFIDLVKSLPQFKFKMIGGLGHGEENLYADIKSQALSLDNLDFLGFVPIAEVDAHYNGARLFVNTSRSEGFPNSFLQSWARKIPTVSFFDCGARLVTGEHVNELVSNENDMKEKVCQFMNEDDIWAESGLISEKYCIENHSVECAIRRLESVFYDQV
jgi:glycosyltransferase involved in cell wall biosynthesis